MLRDVHIVLDMNKTYPKRRDYLFSFNLYLDLLILALENLYFNTLDREKLQGKSLGCIKNWFYYNKSHGVVLGHSTEMSTFLSL